ncbi:MAG: hypothetical protein AB8F94_14830 [Saprospiraceae bacterium]
MKNLFQKIAFLFLFINFAFVGHAQKLTIKDGMVTHDDKMYPAIIVQMEPNTKKVKKELKDWMDDEFGFKLDGYGIFRKRDVLDAEQVTIPEVSNKRMDFYAEIIENGSVTEMKIFGAFGYSIPISKEHYPSEYRAMKNMTINFVADFLPKYYLNKIDDTKEMLSDIEKERKDLNEDMKDNIEDIADLKAENIELTKEEKEKANEEKMTAEKLKIEQAKLKAVKKKLKEKNNSEN